MKKRLVLLFLLPLAADALASGATLAAAPKVVATATEGSADTNTNRAAAELLEQRLQGLQRYRANFRQIIEGGRGEILERSSGQVLLSRPNFRWQVEEPFPQQIVATDAKLWVYDPDLAQVIVKPMDTALADTPVTLLTREAVVLNQSFSVTHSRQATQQQGAEAATDNAKNDVFTLTPRQQESLYSEIRLQFDGPKLVQLGILDHLGQYTLIRFSEVEHPAMVDSGEFDLDLPPDIDVIEG